MGMGFTAAVRRVRAGALAAVVAGLAAGCGGGGGGTGAAGPAPGGDTGLSLANIQAAGTTQRVFDSPQALGQVSITADVKGDLSRLNGQTVFVIVEDPDGLFESTPQVFVSGNGIGNRIDLFGRSLQGRQGSYRRPLRVNVCLDASCLRPFGGSPFEVPLAVDVLPGVGFGSATPLVIDMPFGAAASDVSVPLTLPPEVFGWSADVTPPGNPFDAPFTLEQRPAPAMLLHVQRLPAGRFDRTIEVHAQAVLDGQFYNLQALLPVTINVQAAPGVLAAWSLPNVQLDALTSGFAVDGGSAFSYLIAADGVRYGELSRIEYLPAGPDGNLDANGIRWLNVGIGVDSVQLGAQTLFAPQTNACQIPDFGNNIRCLAPGRYDALVYARSAAGVELPLPLRVSVLVRPG